MAFGGPGFGEALFQNSLKERQAGVMEKELELKEGELGFKLQDLQERRSAAKQQAVQQGLNQSVERMKMFAEAVAGLGPNYKAGSPLDKAIDVEKGILAKFAEMVGLDPNLGQAMADKARSAAQRPPETVVAAPGSSVLNKATGETISTVPRGPSEFENKIAVMERQLGRKLTQQEVTQMGGAAGTATQAQSPAGKVVADRQLFVSQYGENSPQVKAFDEASAAGDVKLDDVGSMRKEFTALSKDFVTIRDAFGKVAVADPSAAGDVARVFAFMKMLDPNSSVREGEYANAQNAGGVPDRVANMYNKVLDGTFLTDDQRKDFNKQAENVFKVQMRNQLQNEDQYRGIAKRNKMREEDVIIDFVGPYRKTKPAKPDGGGAKPDDEDPLGLRKKK